jgi:hypothetical protein
LVGPAPAAVDDDDVTELEVDVPVAGSVGSAAPCENRLSPFGPPQISPAAPDSWRQLRTDKTNKKMVKLKILTCAWHIAAPVGGRASTSGKCVPAVTFA